MYERLYPGMDWSAHADHWPLAEYSHFIQAAGVRWHVQHLGQGPVLLLLHGTGSGSFSWRDLMPLLAPHFMVVAPDLPGHAFSSRGPEGTLSLPGMSEALRALMLQMDLRPDIIVGHSAGAAIAAHLALGHRRMARTALIGLNPAWLPLPGPAAWLFGPAARLAALNPLSAWATARMAHRPGAVARWVARTGSALDARGLELYTRVLGDAGHVHGVLSMMAAWQLKPLAQQLPQLDNPVYMAIGAQDRTVPPGLSDQACRLMPQARRWMQPGLGHLAHEQDPAGTARQILHWCLHQPGRGENRPP